ncbi:hypothetical protein NK6_4752 [Bradyrhizobium diazoefficiens]|uniref:Uncharacterized protein n=1 Tax=Bradyrhizobium diazoefficiens TaxID=1355477 RepID=A0A0E4FU16_9BRAD|nr:hypothetical protein NK6_4752 [Bradyrhizobium diazoefficiens]
MMGSGMMMGPGFMGRGGFGACAAPPPPAFPGGALIG